MNLGNGSHFTLPFMTIFFDILVAHCLNLWRFHISYRYLEHLGNGGVPSPIRTMTSLAGSAEVPEQRSGHRELPVQESSGSVATILGHENKPGLIQDSERC